MGKFLKIMAERRLLTSIVLSLIIHLLALLLNFDFFLSPPKEKLAKNQTIEIELSDQKEIKKILEAQRNNKKVEKAKRKLQIVNNELDGLEKKSKTRFLGEKDQFYGRQTIARKIDKFKKAGRGQDQVEESVKQQGSQVKANQQNLKLSDFSFAKANNKGLIKKLDSLKKQAKKRFKSGVKYGDPQSFGAAANNDFIDDVPLGDMTHLNTKEFKFFGFYHRIRQKLEQYWGKSLKEGVETIYKSGKKLVQNENYITSLRIVLNGKGKIVNVSILGTSGHKELDNAAINSFNNAGPFPNPPQGMVINGKASIEWSFVLTN